MGIIAWIVLGLAAGLLANMLIPGKRSQGLIITCLIGIAGALGGGWVATKLFHIHTLNGFFNLSTWLTAIAGAAVLLVVYRAVNGRSGHAVGGRSGNRMVRR
jgi:uncharacterized membrane protein YeaQ/YmgE (transglycosylase-associated protein family)